MITIEKNNFNWCAYFFVSFYSFYCINQLKTFENNNIYNSCNICNSYNSYHKNHSFKYFKYQYGNDKRNVVGIVIPKNNNGKLVFLVHGGGFVNGAYNSKSMKVLANFFLQRGYIVASVEYRVCPDVKWYSPVDDIAKGINSTFEFLNKEGIKPKETVYVGFSAGSVAGALILYSNKYPSVYHIDKFIGISGPYSPIALNKKTANYSIKKCNLIPNRDLVYNGKSDTEALLIEGVDDEYDLYPKTNNSHLEYLERILESRGIYVIGFWAKNNDGSPCGHKCPLKKINDGDKDIINVIDDFLDHN